MSSNSTFTLMRFIGLVVFLFLSFGYTSCIQDECVDTVCKNGGVCVLGNCSCLNGYEGTNCTEVWNLRFLGKWYSEDKLLPLNVSTSTDSVTPKTSFSEFSVITNGRPDQFVIERIGSLDSILCRRLSYREFAVAEGQIIDSNVSILSGSGFIDSGGKAMELTYTTEIRESVATYKLIWTR